MVTSLCLALRFVCSAGAMMPVLGGAVGSAEEMPLEGLGCGWGKFAACMASVKQSLAAPAPTRWCGWVHRCPGASPALSPDFLGSLGSMLSFLYLASLFIPRFPFYSVKSLSALRSGGALGWQRSISPKLCPALLSEERKIHPRNPRARLSPPRASGRTSRVL